MLHWNRISALLALPLSLTCQACAAGSAQDTSAAAYFSNEAAGDSGIPDVSTAMKGLLSTAREGGDVLRTWAAYKAGDKSALPKLFELAQGGNSRAQNVVGYLLDHGEGVRQDSTAAAAYFAAASADYPLARYNLAVLTLLGRGVVQDKVKAMEMFESSMKEASVDLAAVRLSLYYLSKGDTDRAWEWANEGANRGNVTAYYLLGRMLYDSGEYQEAYNWLTKAAQASEPNAPAILSAMYKNGNGIDKNMKMAASWMLIYYGLNKGQSNMNSSKLSSFGLTAKEMNDATSFSTTWLSNHRLVKRPNYNATLLQSSK
jgi:TPR repeat protein